MDRFLTFGRRGSKGKGGVLRALPFLALVALGAPARADLYSSVSDGSLDAGVRLLYTPPAELDSLARTAGYPKTGGLWVLWGGGATITPGPLRAEFSAWEGTLGASSGGYDTGWRLGLAALNLEQAYPWNDFVFTAGVSVEAGQIDGTLMGGGSFTSVQAPLFGYSSQVGVRWPAQTPLAVFLRAGWEVLYGPGTWHGSLAPNLGNTLFELGGPTATAQLEMSL